MKYNNLRAFEKHLAAATPNHFADLYVIISKDSFARKLAIDSLLSLVLKTKKNAQHCVKIIDGSSVSADEIFSELHALPLFSDRQVIIIEQAEKLPKPLTKQLENLFTQKHLPALLVFSAVSITSSTNFYKSLEKAGVILELLEEKGADKERAMADWITEKVMANGKKIDLQACQYLLKQMGNDYALLHHEIEKLICYIGERPTITLQDVGAICINVNLENVWQLGEAIFRRDSAKALRIIKALISDGTAFLALLRQIRNQFQTDFQVCSILVNGGTPSDISQLFPYMKGFILDKHIRIAREYGMGRFKTGMQTIDALELMAKNSGLEDQMLAELLIARLNSN